MATVMYMEWPTITREKYEEAREHVNWEGDTPDGALFHVAWFDDETGFHVLDLWESAQAFNAFAEQRLMPGLREIGIEGDPTVRFADVHRVFTPAYQPA
jgi:hypothetical protein